MYDMKSQKIRINEEHYYVIKSRIYYVYTSAKKKKELTGTGTLTQYRKFTIRVFNT